MKNQDLINQVKLLSDRAAIWDCLMNYCKGMDDSDRELVLSSYHPGAIDDHGPYRGPPEGLVDFAFGFHNTAFVKTQHTITAFRAVIDGTSARVENNFIFSAARKDGKGMVVIGQYKDKFEQISGRWAITARHCSSDIVLETESVSQAAHLASFE